MIILTIMTLSSSGKGESLACQITSHFNNKLGYFSNKIKKIAFQDNLSFCWMGKLSGRLVTPLYLKNSIGYCIQIEKIPSNAYYAARQNEP